MLLTNNLNDKLYTFHSALASQNLLPPQYIPPDPFDADRDDVGPLDSNLASAKVELAKTRGEHSIVFIIFSR